MIFNLSIMAVAISVWEHVYVSAFYCNWWLPAVLSCIVFNGPYSSELCVGPVRWSLSMNDPRTCCALLITGSVHYLPRGGVLGGYEQDWWNIQLWNWRLLSWLYPDQIPSCLVDWMLEKGGYLIHNIQPPHADLRFFSMGNFWAVVSSFTTPKKAKGILDLIEEKWDDFVGSMPSRFAIQL